MRSRRWDLVLVVLELLVTSGDPYDVTATRQRPHPESGDHVDGSAPGAGKCEPPARRGAAADDDRRLVIHGRTRLPASVRPSCARPTHHALPRAVRFMHRTGMICTDRWHVGDPRECLSYAHGDFLSGKAGPAWRDTPSYASTWPRSRPSSAPDHSHRRPSRNDPVRTAVAVTPQTLCPPTLVLVAWRLLAHDRPRGACPRVDPGVT